MGGDSGMHLYDNPHSGEYIAGREMNVSASASRISPLSPFSNPKGDVAIR